MEDKKLIITKLSFDRSKEESTIDIYYTKTNYEDAEKLINYIVRIYQI